MMKTSRDGNPLKPRSSGLSNVNAYSNLPYSFVTALILISYTLLLELHFSLRMVCLN